MAVSTFSGVRQLTRRRGTGRRCWSPPSWTAGSRRPPPT